MAAKLQLCLVALVVISHQLDASRFKRQGFVFDTASGGGGEKCVTKDTRQTGQCIEIVKCDEATRILVGNPNAAQRRFLQQRTCKFEGSTPFFCCVTGGGQPPKPPTVPVTPPPTPPPTPAPTTPPKPRTPDNSGFTLMPEAKLNQECGISKNPVVRVVGGTPAALGAWPWMAAIFVGGVFSFVSCGGVLINEQYILTAAHCVVDKATGLKKQESDYTVRLGDLDIATDTDNAQPVDFKVLQLIPHADYNPTLIKNDIAIMKLDKPTQFTDLIRPICLPTIASMVSNQFEGTTPFIAGWGTVEFRGESSNVLRQVSLKVTPRATCQSAFDKFKVTISDTQLCAGFALGGKDACQGDSGGPLMFPDAETSKWYTIGVVSVGFKCAEPVSNFNLAFTILDNFTKQLQSLTLNEMVQSMTQLMILFFLYGYAVANVIRDFDSFKEFDPWNISSESEWIANRTAPINNLNLSSELELSSDNEKYNNPNNNRTGKARWYSRIWHDKLVAPYVEAGSSSSESFNSWMKGQPKPRTGLQLLPELPAKLPPPREAQHRLPSMMKTLMIMSLKTFQFQLEIQDGKGDTERG
ncbi:hypothetical protein CHUAL_007721 [Chamberlinius hualienensis]